MVHKLKPPEDALSPDEAPEGYAWQVFMEKNGTIFPYLEQRLFKSDSENDLISAKRSAINQWQIKHGARFYVALAPEVPQEAVDRTILKAIGLKKKGTLRGAVESFLPTPLG